MKKITYKDLAKIIDKLKNDDYKLRQILQHIFAQPENIDVFAKFCFPETITNKIPDFHKDIYEFMFDKENGALAAPRGHGKSSTVGIIFLCYCIVNKLEPYIVYVSQSHTKTVQFVDPIRNEFNNNNRLKYIYGSLAPKDNKDENGKDREDCFDVNGCRVEAVSFEKNLRGFKHHNMRPTLIIGDDIEDDARVLNPELRDKDSNKLNKVVIPSLDIDGRFKMIGTILHHDSLLKKKIKQCDGKIFRACKPDFTDILWSDRFTEKKLRKIKKDITSVPFTQEYLNNPVDNSKALIKREWITSCYREDLSKQEAEEMNFPFKYCGADFAFSDRITADKTAFATIGCKDEYHYILDCQWFHGKSLQEQMIILKNEIYAKYNHDMLGLEENSIKSITKDIEQYKMPLKLFWTSANDPPARKNDAKDYDWTARRHTVGKLNLIMRMGALFENKQIIIPYKTEKDKETAHQLTAELTSWALADGKLVEAGVHPDAPIALAYALELATQIEKVIIDF